MKIFFPDNHFNPVLRLYLPYWNFEQIIDDTVRYCREADIRDALLFTDAQYLVWNQLSREEVKAKATNLKLAVERFGKLHKESPPIHPIPEASLGVLRKDSHALRAGRRLENKKLIQKTKSKPTQGSGNLPNEDSKSSLQEFRDCDY